MERTDLFELMGKLKLYGMRPAYDEVKQATVHLYFYETHDQLRQHLADFVNAYNFAKRLRPSRVSHLMNTFVSAGQVSPKDST